MAQDITTMLKTFYNMYQLNGVESGNRFLELHLFCTRLKKLK